ncbi:hypothetical protein I4U23_020818 [Adineta vaga]|nr:hypothetical protein I4U23_020818 [Adineta vaga]
MNTSYMSNSSSETINRNKYIDSLIDFSTPMSSVSKQWKNQEQISSNHSNNSTVINETMLDMNNNHNHETIIGKFLEKFREHETNFQQTQTCLHSLDGHLREITNILNQLEHSFDYHSVIKSTTDQLQTRLLQMSTKREQIRTITKNFYQSPTIIQTLNDIIQQISPSTSKLTMSTDPMIYYNELINAVRLSLNQKNHLIERFHHEQMHRKHRTNDYHLKIQERQKILLQLMEKFHEQQKQNENYIERFQIDKPKFNHHNEHLTELNKLIEEYQTLQEENRLLKHQAKENIRTLYTFISQTTE